MNWYLKAFRNKFNFSGRASRAEFWAFFLGNHLIGALLAILALASAFGLIWVTDSKNLGTYLLALFAGAGAYMLFWLLMFVPTLAVVIRRLHDSGRSGKWLLLYVPVVILGVLASLTHTMELRQLGSLIEVLVSITMLVLMLIPGAPAENPYGPPSAISGDNDQ